MELVNPLSSFRWTEPLDVGGGVKMMGVAEKQGWSFSRHGYLAALDDPTLDADAVGRAVRRQLRPLSGPTLAKARDEYKRQEVIRFPRYFITEPQSHCNRKCFFCPISVVERFDENGDPANGIMRWADHQKLMDECAGFDVYGLSLYQLGESFLWRGKDEQGNKRDIADMVNYATRKAGFKAVNLSTNGDVVNLNCVLGSDLADLFFSIDGTTRDVYDYNRESTKPNDTGAFDRTIARVMAFLEEKAKSGLARPWCRVQIINNHSTAHQVLDFIKFWINVPGVDDIYCKNLDGMSAWLGDSVVSKEEGAIKMDKVRNMPCQHLWAIGSVTSSGGLNACCHDSRFELSDRSSDGKLANIRTGSFAEWWNGKFMNDLRAEHMAGVQRLPCKNCAERDPWLGAV